MTTKLIPLLAILALGVFSADTFGQREKGKGKKSGPLPLQGKALPNVTAYDETGAEFSLTQKLKGRHAVIVFGCLT